MTMVIHNGANERIKRSYFDFLREAKGRNVSSIDRAAASLARFEVFTGGRDFKKFRREQAVAFKKQLSETVCAHSNEKLSKSTVFANLRDLKAFFEWLSREPGYRSIQWSDAAYFNLSDKDTELARRRSEKNVPTIDQVSCLLSGMSAGNEFERRDRALIACLSLTGARADALASFQLRHVDLQAGFIYQDARHVRTKFSKSFRTYLMPVCEGAKEIFEAWVLELCGSDHSQPSDPLFPATARGFDKNGCFHPKGLSHEGWQSTAPVRAIVRRAFIAAGMPYFSPHSFRHMLVRHAMSLSLTPEMMKAWSQNLGHSGVTTTFTSYGSVPTTRQGKLISETAQNQTLSRMDAEKLLAKVRKLVGERY